MSTLFARGRLLLLVCTGDVRPAASTTVSSNYRLSLVVVGVITTSCCVVTALVTLAVVIVVVRHRRRRRDASSRRHCEKSATATPLIASFRPADLPPTVHRHQSAPRLLPDVAKCESDAEGHQYDVLETASVYYWPRGGGTMPGVGGGSCPCSSCLLASTSHVAGSRLYSPVLRQTASDRC